MFVQKICTFNVDEIDYRRNYREHKTLLCGAKIHSSDALTVSNVTLLPILWRLTFLKDVSPIFY